jgi:pimeloyl-ACP methyl ester carboxylesterase
MKVVAFLLVVLAAYAVVCLVAFLNQRSLIYFPTPPVAAAPASELILNVDGAVLRNWIVRRDGRRALLYFGGNAEEVGANVAPFSAAIPDRTLVFVQYRGYGGSSGKPSEDALVADALALFDRMAADHDDIAVIGRSLGSGVAVQLAARRPVRSLVLITPFDSLVSVGQGAMPWLPVSLLALDRYDSAKVAKEVGARTLVMIATADDIVPPRHARTRAVDAPGFGHNDIQGWPVFYSAIADAVR